MTSSADPRGPKPGSRVLRRALFEDVDAFFAPAPASSSTPGQTFAEFVRRNSDTVGGGNFASLAAGNRAVGRLWWLSSRPLPVELDTPRQAIEDLLTSFLAPFQLEPASALPSSALGRAATALFRSSTQRAESHSKAFLDALRRQVSSDTALAIAICVSVADGEVDQETVVFSDGPLVLLMIGMSFGNLGAFELVQIVAACLIGCGLDPCSFYECLLNSPCVRTCPPPLRLCPVCLRKLGVVVGDRWDVTRHYEGLLGWHERQGRRDEAAWYRERLQVITERFIEESPVVSMQTSEARAAKQSDPPSSAVERSRIANEQVKASGGKPRPGRGASTDKGIESVLHQWTEVVITGCPTQLRSLNGTYRVCGSCHGRPAFQRSCSSDGGRGGKGNHRRFLYYQSVSDTWGLGPEVGSEALWADCGPCGSECRDLEQTWRLWDGLAWTEDPGVVARGVMASATRPSRSPPPLAGRRQ
eukprot:TRINITY_DN34463_c0_g2_i1.p1 TRINITY_DN34463_c0_g2~~TRINITY_DN34463_c0_g2_i1.p1  ORF type:complete len:493 (+),score=57.20 TRINITY_DN34463_c0_g2_i1:62-1480(+)